MVFHVTEPWWPDSPQAAAARFAWLGFGISMLGFVLCWIPFLGIFFGHVFGIVSLVLAIIAILRPFTPPFARLGAVAALLIAIITLVLKAIPVVNLL